MQDHFARRCEFAIRDAVAHGIRPWDADPPVDRLLRKLGLRTRPPYYRSFGANMIAFGWFFGTFWGIFMWLGVWSRNSMPISVAVMTSVGAGLAFGAIMAAVVARKRRKAGLTRWDDLPS